METLPDRVVERIASYLRLRDLLNCSAVCKKWRKMLNTDAIWIPRLQLPSKYYKIQEKFKEMILCPPDVQTLEPLCVMRERCIRDQCLKFNCTAGLFTVEGFKPKTDYPIIQLINRIDEEGNYWLFLNTAPFIEVWNITNKPYFQTSVSKSPPRNLDNMYVLDSKVILVINNLVQVYSFEHPEYKLTLRYCVLLNLEQILDNLQFLTSDSLLFQRNMKHVLHGKILIGYTGVCSKSQLPSAFMHVWNMDTMVKLCTQYIVRDTLMMYLFNEEEYDRGSIRFEIFKGSSKCVAIVVQVDNEDKSAISVFNTETFKFIDIVRPIESAEIVWCTLADTKMFVLGTIPKTGCFVGLFDIEVKNMILKQLNRLGVDNNSQIVFGTDEIYFKTANRVFSVKFKEDTLIVSTLIEYPEFCKEFISVSNTFIFSKNGQGLIKIWDMDFGWIITDLSNFKGNIDIRKLASLNELRFPPKIVFTDEECSSVHILSFW